VGDDWSVSGGTAALNTNDTAVTVTGDSGACSVAAEGGSAARRAASLSSASAAAKAR